ncbi:ROK family protein [Levilactobacillus brevis]|uniref:ROK family protein n=1 Tax=Levilactobacillus brevis TaxID=1580 RepID=UPI001F41BC94|nr:ROK family protein [Levilactobacillus brevis]MCE6019710.1 ROK family protein [Levilactobacillus brevis]
MTTKGVLAIDIGGTKIALAAIDLAGHWLAQTKFVIAGLDGGAIVTQLLAASQQLVSQAQLTVTGIGVSTIGVVDGEHLKLVPTIKGWDHVNLKAALQRQFTQIPVWIENDVKAATYAEVLNGALKGTTAGLYLNLGTGIATGLSLGDRVIRGSHGAAGEVGYLLTASSDAGFAAGHAPFEEATGGQAIGRQLTALVGSPYSAKDMWSNAELPQVVQRFKTQLLASWAFNLANLCITWDPAVVAIGGGHRWWHGSSL